MSSEGASSDPLTTFVEVEDFESAFDSVFTRLTPTPVLESLRVALRQRDDPARAIVVEHSYVDRDFTAAYYMQAGRAFMPTTRDATRVHFFAEQVTIGDFDSADPAAHLRLSASYLGCAVIRPSSPPSLGRTFIKPPATVLGGAAVFGTQGRFRVSLLGHRLSVWACPFMSQDGQALACATAALWMATATLVGRDEYSRAYSTAELTQIANGLHRGFGPRLGAVGLTVDQIEHTLLEMGYDPLVLDSARPRRMRDLIIAYADSGFAPILIVPLRQGTHAMTVVGRIDEVGRLRNEGVGGPIIAGALPGDIIVHDDQQGMYLRAQIVDDEGQAPRDDGRRTSRLVFDAGHGAGLEGGLLQTVLVPVPHRIMADFEAIASRLSVELTRLKELIGTFRPDHPMLQRPIAARPICIRSREFKEKQKGRKGLSPVVREFYARLPMPRYVWLVELAFADGDVSFGSAGDLGQVFGELVLDSTMPNGADIVPLAQHAASYIVGLAVRGHGTASVSRYVPDDQPYAHYVSPAMAQEDE